MFFGILLCTVHHIEFKLERDWSLTYEKKEPCETRWFWSLSSWLARKAFNTPLEFWYVSYCTFTLELVHLQRSLTSWFVEDLRAFLKTTWHCVNFVEGSYIFKQNFVLDKKILLRVALTGSSSHWRIYFETVLSRFSQTHVLEIFATVKFHEIFERIYLW